VGDFQKGNSKFANMNGNKIMIERENGWLEPILV
jgi:hypothetical protein